MKTLFQSVLSIACMLSLFGTQLSAQNTVSPAPVTSTTDDVADMQYTKAIKFSPLAPLFGHWNVSFEKARVFGKNSNMEIMVGLNTKPLLFAPSLEGLSMIGSNIDFGPKIYFGKQEFTVDGMRRTHLLYGKYFKPELGVSYISYKYTDSGTSASDYLVTTSLLFLLGRQWVSDRFVVDFNGGVGYAYRATSDSDVNNALENIPVAIKIGFKIGFLY